MYVVDQDDEVPGKGKGLPPPPVLPPPPAPAKGTGAHDPATLAAQARQQMIAAGVQMTPELMAAFEAMEGKNALAPGMGHKQLNLMHKAEKRVNHLKTNISKLDQAWNVFLENLNERYAEQVTFYQDRRNAMLDELVEAKQAYTEAKTNLRQLSEQLAEERSPSELADNTQVDEEDLRNFFQANLQPHQGYPSEYELLDAEMQPVNELCKDLKKVSPPPVRKGLRPFAATKVNQTHLKSTKPKAKAKDADDKDVDEKEGESQEG